MLVKMLYGATLLLYKSISKDWLSNIIFRWIKLHLKSTVQAIALLIAELLVNQRKLSIWFDSNTQRHAQTRTKSNLFRYSYSVLFNYEILIPFSTANNHRIYSKSHSFYRQDWTVPDYSTLFRRRLKHLNITVSYQKITDEYPDAVYSYR